MSEENTEKKVAWIRKPGQYGEMLFTFDGEKVFNLFRDYPHELTPEQKEIFDAENPFWAGFFAHRSQKPSV